MAGESSHTRLYISNHYIWLSKKNDYRTQYSLHLRAVRLPENFVYFGIANDWTDNVDVIVLVYVVCYVNIRSKSFNRNKIRQRTAKCVTFLKIPTGFVHFFRNIWIFFLIIFFKAVIIDYDLENSKRVAIAACRWQDRFKLHFTFVCDFIRTLKKLLKNYLRSLFWSHSYRILISERQNQLKRSLYPLHIKENNIGNRSFTYLIIYLLAYLPVNSFTAPGRVQLARSPS